MGSRGRIAPTCPHYPRYQQGKWPISRFPESGIDDSLITVRRKRRRGKPKQSEELTRSGRPKTPSGGGGKPGRGYPGLDREAESAAQAVAKSGPAEGSAQAGPEAPSGRTAKADRSLRRKRCASGAEARGGSKRASDCDKPGIELEPVSSKALLLPPAVSRRAAEDRWRKLLRERRPWSEVTDAKLACPCRREWRMPPKPGAMVLRGRNAEVR
jgi:hypothetical protein